MPSSSPSPPVTALDLTSLAQDLLIELVRSRVTRSSVHLALDVWSRRGPGPGAGLGFDPVGIVDLALAELNGLGLVTYRETVPPYVVIVDIRVTPDGYRVAGFPLAHREVGRSRQVANDSSIRPGDRTDFRTHSTTAEGGPIERSSLPDHLAEYPEHRPLHADALAEWRAVQTGERPMRHNDQYVDAPQPPPLPPVEPLGNSSARAVTLRLIAGGATDLPTIAQTLHRRGLVVPSGRLRLIVHKLHNEGLVSFVEHGNGKKTVIDRIEATERGRDYLATADRRGSVVDLSADLAILPGDEPASPPYTHAHEPETSEPTREPSAPKWPVLRALRARAAALAAVSTRVDALTAASASLEAVDPVAARTLMARAEQVVDEAGSLSPVEAEYLALADEVLRAQGADEVVNPSEPDGTLFAIIMDLDLEDE